MRFNTVLGLDRSVRDDDAFWSHNIYSWTQQLIRVAVASNDDAVHSSTLRFSSDACEKVVSFDSVYGNMRNTELFKKHRVAVELYA
jgi:dTDP-D-glucose 4,6-dehydratase